jgi:hypothetical protein
MSDLFSAGLVRLLQATNADINNSTTEAPSAVNTSLFQPSSSEPSNSNDGSDYEFIAFIVWYICLIMCCIVPTFCAYRRRRLLHMRFAQHQARQEELRQWGLRQPDHVFLTADGVSSNGTILLQRQDLMESETAKAERVRRLEESLKETTFVVQEGDVIDVSSASVKEGSSTRPNNDNSSSSLQLQNMEDAALADLDVTCVLQLPSRRGNNGVFSRDGNTDSSTDENDDHQLTIPAVCAICLCGYEVGERVAWSEQCHHAFHHKCIVPWLAKQNDAEPKCPCCRQVYCQIEPITVTNLVNSNDYNGVLNSTPVTFMTLTPLEFMVAVRSGGNGLFLPQQVRIHQIQQNPSHNRNTLDIGATITENEHTTNEHVDTAMDIERGSNGFDENGAHRNRSDHNDNNDDSATDPGT